MMSVVQESIGAVEKVLAEIQADDVPTLLLYNKIDQTDFQPHIEFDGRKQQPRVIYLSAKVKAGLDGLSDAIRQCLTKDILSLSRQLRTTEGNIRH